MSKNILVVDDEEDILELVKYNLIKEGYSVNLAASGKEALQIAREEHFDLIVLDLMLPDLDGFSVCTVLKKDSQTKKIPIMMLTAKNTEASIITGLELGADDYLTKPFSPKIFIARVKSIFRREDEGKTLIKDVISIDEMVIDTLKHKFYIKNNEIELTISEFRALHLLANNQGCAFSRYQIIDSIKGGDHFVTDRSIDVVITGLRKKLGSYNHYIETVRGVGYRFKD